MATGHYTGVVFVELSKAFSMVPTADEGRGSGHLVLMARLLPGLRDFPIDRMFSVRVLQSKSQRSTRFSAWNIALCCSAGQFTNIVLLPLHDLC